MTQPEIHPQRLDPRRAGHVKRYHTWPTLQKQDVASHTWQVLRILVSVWPDAPQELLVFVTAHDMGETGAGDPPYPTKARDPVLKAAFDAMEHEACVVMSTRFLSPVPDTIAELSLWPLQLRVYKLCHEIEMWEFALNEMNLGNRYAAPIAEAMWSEIQRRTAELEAASEEDTWLSPVLTRLAFYVRARADYEAGVSDGGDASI